MAFPLRGVKSRYEIKEQIAQGGMGVVYKAYDKVMKRTVALKTLLDLSDPRALQLFQKECEDLTSLSHPNIVPIFDVGRMDEDGGKPYMVMPLLQGVTLEKLIDGSSSRLTVERCVDMFCQTCRGLQAAHERGLVHRDVKPSNIFVMEDDSVGIIDFGVAHRVTTGQTIGRKGTLPYMSPEQVAMKPLTPASDIFSAAVTFYEALTRRKVFHRSDEQAVADAIRSYIPPPAHEINPEVPAPLSKTIHKGMAKDPLHRYRSAREFSDIMQKAWRGEPIDMFNPARIRPRLEKARQAFAANDYEFANEIVGELKSEGYIEPDIEELDQSITRAQIQRRTSQLIETARSRVDEGEFQIALQKVEEALQLDPRNMDALTLKARIDRNRSERDVDGWIGIARNHIENKAFGPAREAIKRALELRPREPKANQLLTELERLEQSYFRSREEKERLFNAAVSAEQGGDISSAVSKLERVLELDKQSPDAARSSQYQRLYDKVRSEHESSKTAWAGAKRLLDRGEFAQALAICNENIAKRPNETSFKALKVEIEEKHRQAVSARMAETDRQVEAEPDLDRRVDILEKALSENPGEDHFERALQNAREKRDMVASIVTRARTYESNDQFSDAIAQWEIVQSLYSRYPGLPIEIDRLARMRDQSRRKEAKARWVEQIDHALELGDEARALELVRMAREEFQDDPELVQLGRLAQQGLARRERAHALLAEGRTACQRGAFEAGITALREAYDLDGADEQIRDLLVQAMVEEGRRQMDANPRQAFELFNQVLEIEPGHALVQSLQRMLADQRRSESLDELIASARELQAEGRIREAYDRVKAGLSAHPNEGRLLQLQSLLGRALQDVRKRDLDQIQRLDRELVGTSALDNERYNNYDQRINRYMSEYGEDQELQTALNSARRRLQTVYSTGSSGTGQAPRFTGNSASQVKDQSSPDEGGASLVSEIGLTEQTGGGAGLPPKPKIAWSRFLIPAAAVCAVALLVVAAILFTRKKPAPPTPPPAVQTAFVELTAQPAGVQVSVDGQPASGSGNTLRIEQAPGSHSIAVSKPGYKTDTQTVSFVVGKPGSLQVTLLPEDPILRIAGTAKVFLDGDIPTDVKDGEPTLPLPPGDHTVRIQMSAASQAAFKLHVDKDGLAEVSDLTAKEMTPLVVSNFGPNAKLYGIAGPAANVHIGDQVAGALSPQGVDLSNLTASAGEIVIGEGKDAKKMTVDTAPGRAVTAQLEADPNIGTLIVTANEDGATVVLTSNGKEYRRATIAKGQAAFMNVRAREYAVNVTKPDFEQPPAQQVKLAKGQTQNLQFNLVHTVSMAKVVIHTLPGAELVIDGDQSGVFSTVDPKSPIVRELAPGQHTIDVKQGRFRGEHKVVQVRGGQQEISMTDLELAPGGIKLSKLPATTVVSYAKDGKEVKLAGEGPIQLPEGAYELKASAPGYRSKEENIEVRAGEFKKVDISLVTETPTGDPMERIFGKGQWTLDSSNWYTHRGDMLVPAKTSLDIQFEAQLTDAGFARKRRLTWVTHATDGDNRIQYELTEGHLTVTLIKDGQKSKIINENVPKAGTYLVRIESRPDHVTVSIQGQAIGTVSKAQLDGMAAGNFGFAGNKEIKLADFQWNAR